MSHGHFEDAQRLVLVVHGRCTTNPPRRFETDFWKEEHTFAPAHLGQANFSTELPEFLGPFEITRQA
jgi:hypothetical protein